MSGRPLDVLEEALHEPVTVRLKSDDAYYGRLAGYDQHLNLVLDPPATDEQSKEAAVGDTTVIRGDNVVTIER